MITATVLPDVTGLDKVFDYLVPDDLVGQVRVGSMVRVVLHGRRVGGWVLRIGEPTVDRLADVPLERLVPITRWSGHGPSEEVLELADWAAHRWGAGRLRPFLVTASPPRVVRGLVPAQPLAPRRIDGASSGVRSLLDDPDDEGVRNAGDPGSAGRAFEAVGGGVVRVTPSDDPMPILLAAAELGRVLVLHPSVDEAALLAARLRGSGLSTALLPDGWASAANGAAHVVVGARSAVWASVPHLSAIVVLDEHDEAHQEERTPTWHARDVAIERGRRAGIPVVLVSPCPTVSALAWSGTRWMRPSASDEYEGWPNVELVDRRGDEPWKRSLVTGPLIEALRDPTLRVVCVHNTPGRARLMACRTCRSLLECERCEASVQQRDDLVLECRRCGTTRPPVCQACGSTALANVRPGVTRLRDELEKAAARPVVAITGSSSESAADLALDLAPSAARDAKEAAGIVVGTEAALHRVREADVVAFVDIDAELLAPRYRAAEQAMALLVRAARLLGPRDDRRRLLVQTFRPEHEVLQAAVRADPGLLAKVEARRRRDLGLPPFSALARVSGDGAAEFVEMLPVATAPDGDGFLVRAADWDELGDLLSDTPRPKSGSRSAKLRIEVDPARR